MKKNIELGFFPLIKQKPVLIKNKNNSISDTNNRVCIICMESVRGLFFAENPGTYVVAILQGKYLKVIKYLTINNRTGCVGIISNTAILWSQTCINPQLEHDFWRALNMKGGYPLVTGTLRV